MEINRWLSEKSILYLFASMDDIKYATKFVNIINSNHLNVRIMFDGYGKNGVGILKFIAPSGKILQRFCDQVLFDPTLYKYFTNKKPKDYS